MLFQCAMWEEGHTLGGLETGDLWDKFNCMPELWSDCGGSALLESLLTSRGPRRRHCMKGETQRGSCCGQGREEQPRAGHHVNCFLCWEVFQAHPLCSLPTYCRIHHLLLQEGGLASSEVETCVTAGFPGLGRGEETICVVSRSHG